MLAGVRLGDAVVGLDHEALLLYDHIMARLPHLPRPLVVGFRKKMEGLGSSPRRRPRPRLASRAGGAMA